MYKIFVQYNTLVANSKGTESARFASLLQKCTYKFWQRQNLDKNINIGMMNKKIERYTKMENQEGRFYCKPGAKIAT